MDLKTDIDCLIECLRYHPDDARKARDTILTIASLCSGSDEAQNLLRTSGGLSFLVNVLSTAQDESLCMATLYALGCATERNVFSQSRLCTDAMFQFLYSQLTNEQFGVQMKRTTTFLIMCLVTNNRKGQTLVRKTRCLDSMLQLFRNFPGLNVPYNKDVRCFDEDDEKLSFELWKDVTGTLCGCVNNPQNDENQLVCASSVPAALYIMSHSQDSHVIQLLCSYISLLAANNVVNQDRFHMLGGLEVIVSKLPSIIDDIIMEPEKGLILSASNMISMLSSLIADNDNNVQALASLKVVPLLLRILALDVISLGVKLKVIITIGCLVSASEGKELKDMTEDCLSENEDQVAKEPISKGKLQNLAARIDILQKALQEERRLRKHLEDEKVNLQVNKEGSCADKSRDEDEISMHSHDLPLQPHPNSPVSVSDKVHDGKQQSFVQLQERMDALERKLCNIASNGHVTNVNNDSASSETSDSESIVHRSVSEAENEESQRPIKKPKNRKVLSKKTTPVHIAKQSTVKKTSCQQQVTTDMNVAEELPQFKIPPPVKRCRPLELVNSSVSSKKLKSAFPGRKPLSQHINYQNRGEVTPTTKDQKIDVNCLTVCQESSSPCVFSRNSSGKTSRKRRSDSSSVYRTLTYGSGDVNGLSVQLVDKKMNKDNDSDAKSDYSDASAVSTIADSVFSSLTFHLSCPIRPVNQNPSRPLRHGPFQAVHPSPNEVKLLRSPRHMLVPQGKPRKDISNQYSKDHVTDAKSNINVFDFEEDVKAGKKESSHGASCHDAIYKANHKGYEMSTSTNADQFPQENLSHISLAKLNATPKVMLKKPNLKGKNMNMYTYGGKYNTKDLALSNNDNNHEGNQCYEDNLRPFPSSHHNGYGSQKESAKLHIGRGSGNKAKSYSVHYVRGKIQCSRLYRGKLSRAGITPDVCSSTLLKCPGCAPPRHYPLLDSRTLLHTLMASRRDLCIMHNRLVASITSYITNKVNRLRR
ncbi:telomere repeats-binding bouquet formation protein 1-like isoform X2 [Lytechinus variegatus]|uniref:telomere repeats-binding bouquet formation protein 1-like isoform X2 n=1 Tax=Lytechinus variegatus TaxID=7654 RepID=UPI001BB1C2D6|nr:telomere repeats-binding bouquet formation protein 1-like isoform X2 [Lytechinus variegatus]